MRPQLYIGEKSIKLLKAFLDGYIHAYYLNGETCGFLMIGFQEYIADFYNDRRTLSWCELITEHSPPADEPLDVFFKHFHDYCAMTLPLDRNDLSGEV